VPGRTRAPGPARRAVAGTLAGRASGADALLADRESGNFGKDPVEWGTGAGLGGGALGISVEAAVAGPGTASGMALARPEGGPRGGRDPIKPAASCLPVERTERLAAGLATPGYPVQAAAVSKNADRTPCNSLPPVDPDPAKPDTERLPAERTEWLAAGPARLQAPGCPVRAAVSKNANSTPCNSLLLAGRILTAGGGQAGADAESVKSCKDPMWDGVRW
jgi:hypothetical protein